MPTTVALAKAQLQKIDPESKQPVDQDTWTVVQFNPDTLKISYANQLTAPSGTGDQRGSQTKQFVGAGTTKLAVQLYFDVTNALPDGLTSPNNDVRDLTKKVAYFITPVGDPPNNPNPKEFKPPMLRFAWGSFSFDGIVESLEETLEYFSPEGRPLRASVSLNVTQQRILPIEINAANTAPGATRRGGSAAGTNPLTAAPAGATVQGLANQAGISDWQSVAAANGIENPRVLASGQLLDLNASAGGGLTASVGLTAGVSAGASVSVNAGVSVGADLGVSADADIGGNASVGF